MTEQTNVLVEELHQENVGESPESNEARPQSRAEYVRKAKLADKERDRRRKEQEEKRTAWAIMQSNMDKKIIVRGRITGLIEMDLKDKGRPDEREVCLSIFFRNGFKGYMPFNEIYRDGANAIEMNTVNLTSPEGRTEFIRRKKAMANKLLELEVPLMITHMSLGEDKNNYDNYLIMASRRNAILEVEKANFEPRGHRKNPILMQGSRVTGEIVSVSKKSIQVNVGGVDTSIPIYNLTYQYIPDSVYFQSLYHVGEPLSVVIDEVKVEGSTTIEVEERGKLVEKTYQNHVLKVSAKQAELDRAKEIQNTKLYLKEECVGIITHIPTKRDGKAVIYLWLRGYNVPAYANSVPVSSNGVPYTSGKLVRVRVEDFHDNGMTRVSLHGFHGPIPTYQVQANDYDYR